MNILSHGLPFFCAYGTWSQYRGKHCVRSMSGQGLGDVWFRPEVEGFEEVWERVRSEGFVPELVLVWTPENDPPPLGIERCPVPVVCLAGDWNLFHQAQEVNFGRYDVVVSDRPGTRVLRNGFCSPVYWGPLYAQNTLLHVERKTRTAPGTALSVAPELGTDAEGRPSVAGSSTVGRPCHKNEGEDGESKTRTTGTMSVAPGHNTARDIDVLYVGNLNLSHRGERGKWLQRLAMMDRRWNILLTTNVWGEEYPELLSRARIVFNRSVRGELNLRVFESMACGALAFFEEANEEVADYFVDGEDIVLFNEENFEERLEYYLTHEAERVAIARRGQEKVKGFSGEARFDDLVDFIMAQPRSGRPFLKLSQMERDLQDHLMVTVSQRVEYGPLEKRLARELVAKYPEEPRAWSALGKSILFYRDQPPNAGQALECLDAHKRALGMVPGSIIHALNGALTAKALGNDKAEEIFLKVALKADSIEPSGYVCGNWQDPFWTGWLRARAEGKISLEMARAEAHARYARIETKRGDGAAALAHLDEALRLAPGNTVYMETRGNLLWDLGRRQEAVGVFVALTGDFPLSPEYRVALAEKCAEVGYGVRAQQYFAEVEMICERLRVPYREPLAPQGHCARREEVEGEESPTGCRRYEWQELRLRARAAETGSHAGLIWFLAALGRMEEVRALEGVILQREDRAAWMLLTKETVSASEGLALLEGTEDLGLFHALVKHCLRAGDVEGAWVVVETAMSRHVHDVTCVNLLARHLSRVGDARLEEAIAKSLAVAPRQEDIAALATTPFAGEIYLGVAPRLVPVTFYLPAYNVAKYIRDTMEHVLLQDYPIAEFFVVNDGSTDESIAIARQFPVTILHHDVNKGLAAARNTALACARGEWVLSVDTDARPEGDYVRKVMMELETRDAEVAAVGGVLIEEFQEDAPDKWRARMMAQHHGPVRQCPPWFLYGSTMGIHRESALAAGGYDEAHRTNGEDTELCKALQRAGQRLCYTPLPRAHHLRRDSVESALRTWWNWHYWVKAEASAWKVVGGMVHGMIHNFAGAGQALQRFLDSGERDLWYLTLLFVFWDPIADLAHGVKIGLLQRGEAKALSELILERARGLEAKFGGAFGAWVARDTAGLRAAFDGAEAAVLSPGMVYEFGRYFEALDGFVESIPEEVYRGAVQCGDGVCPQIATSRHCEESSTKQSGRDDS